MEQGCSTGGVTLTLVGMAWLSRLAADTPTRWPRRLVRRPVCKVDDELGDRDRHLRDLSGEQPSRRCLDISPSEGGYSGDALVPSGTCTFDMTPRGGLTDPVVGQYFGFFNGVSKQHYEEIVAKAPFGDCNLLILAFVHAIEKSGVFVASFTNQRDDPKYPPTPGDSDQDRVKLVVKAARARNPSLKILISLGWGTNDVGNAATTPAPFAESFASLVQTYGLDGVDIDYESTDVEPSDMLVLAEQLEQALVKVLPKREMILTITPAQTSGLDARVLQTFTYTMPQTYDHGGNGTTATWYEEELGSFDRIVYGLNSEGDIGQSDDPKKFAAEAKANQAAGIFAWRLDNDSLDQHGFPTFATGIEMWTLMRSTGSTARTESPLS